METHVDLRVFELLASRLCHDLVSPVGAVKSVAPLDSERCLAIALVNAGCSEAGTQLRVGSVAAEVAPRPSVS